MKFVVQGGSDEGLVTVIAQCIVAERLEDKTM